MTVLPDGLPLADEFPDVTRDEWHRLVEGVLRKTGASDATGVRAEEALATEVEDGITVRPLYTSQDAPQDPGHSGYPGFAPYLRGARVAGSAVSGWDVRQRHAHPDPHTTNRAVLTDLENGAGSVWLAVGEGGVAVDALPEALAGVYLDLAPVVLDAGADFEAAARALLRLYADRQVPPHAALGNLGADPLGLVARTGRDADLPAHLAAAAELAVTCYRDHQGVRALTVDALPYHEAGGGVAQELGCSLAAGVAYLRALTEAGMTIEAACAELEFRYAATADQFTTIAKLRAARRLWARVAEACGAGTAPECAQRQHAVTSPVMMTRRDPWVNMLRTTVASLAAGVGGADAVTVLPFDSAIGLPDDFARRIARNTSTVLLEESGLARVIDPAGGSWYVESLTEEICRAAWAWFQEIEGAGGLAAALASGLVRDRLAATWERRSRDLARRKEPITGVSEFPNLAEPPVAREAAPERPGGGLPRVRRDEAYEALRTRSDAHLADRGTRPRVFLAALGPAAVHTARASFAANLFQAGGIEAVQEPATVDAESVAGAFAASGATVACLCSSDKLYAEQAVAVAERLKAAGAARVLLAGRPGTLQDEYERAGVDGFVHVGCDAVEVLSSALDTMGVR
ncbi:methylmalonyl-CoA mutase small subunit [Streptomyces sp. NPDC021098]|uniref:methylmalonyl-CoA mutase small subunit n=1 Tax=unclassified Streptomyces TaxID=2593676 RepID=UPI00378EBA29